ncbi:MAG TPA: TPM domain-containing protein [Lacibacter sp.]|nr:TPM domain-containing protein [Lacibacter sp.]HMO89479.1 TPM domain-containing protein [Lacibacter sp.]
MKRPLISMIVSWLLLLQLPAGAQTLESFIPKVPDPPTLVNDYLGVLSTTQREELERKLVAYDDSTSNQIVIITIGDIGGNSVDDFAVALGRKWGVGNKDFNNGVVIVVLMDKQRNQRKVFIATGYGLEGAIPDYTAKEIIETRILPNFRSNDIYRGLDEGVTALMQAAAGTYKAPQGYGSRKGKEGGGSMVVAIIMFIVIMIILSNINRRGGGGMVSRRGYRRWDHSPPVFWFPSGGGSGGSSWGGGGGGFGGFGGGSFGGGGAGGSW